jgi:serine/threonine protein kinase
VQVIGSGSMGCVAKVRKRECAVGGSARLTVKGGSSKSRTGVGASAATAKRSETKECFGLLGGFFQFCIRKQNGDDEPFSRSAVIEPVPRPASAHEMLLSSYSYQGTQHTVGSSSSSSHQIVHAMKSIHLERVTDPTFISELKNEVEMLQSLDHPHIVRAIETFEHANQLFVVMELCSGGDLYARDPYTEEEAARITGSILSAISYMHSKGV